MIIKYIFEPVPEAFLNMMIRYIFKEVLNLIKIFSYPHLKLNGTIS
jgi:hypothetical protein